MATQIIKAGTTSLGAANAGDSFYIQEGGQGISGNVDYSAVNTSVTGLVAKGFSGSIGTSANPWITSFSTRLVYGGSGHLYFKGHAADTDVSALVQCTGTGYFHFLTQGTATRFEAISGTQYVANGVTLTTARFGGTASATINDTGTGAAVTTLEVYRGASVYSQRPHTTINLYGGTLTLDADDAGDVNAHTTVNVVGGTLILKDSGTITTINYIDGVIQAARLTRILTITNTNINMTLPGAQSFLDMATNGLIVFTNTPTRLMTDGGHI